MYLYILYINIYIIVIIKYAILVQSLNENFKKHRSPSEHLCVDESIVHIESRSSLKQYNPMKPIKRGYKIWCLADNDGYIYKFDIYTGKSQDFNKEERRYSSIITSHKFR